MPTGGMTHVVHPRGSRLPVVWLGCLYAWLCTWQEWRGSRVAGHAGPPARIGESAHPGQRVSAKDGSPGGSEISDTQNENIRSSPSLSYLRGQRAARGGRSKGLSKCAFAILGGVLDRQRGVAELGQRSTGRAADGRQCGYLGCPRLPLESRNT